MSAVHLPPPPRVSCHQARELSVDVLACEGEYCAAHGNFSGLHVGEWLGHAPSGRRLALDFGMHWRVREGLIVEARQLVARAASPA